jgi:inhibitor of cysteine peptidase
MNRIHEIRRLNAPALALAFLVCLFGCNDGNGGGGGSQTPAAIHFESDDALFAYLKDQYASGLQPDAMLTLRGDMDAGSIAPGDDNTESDGKGYSTTNLQEAGVDEADLVKTDGRYLYIAGEHQITVVSAAPAEPMYEAAVIKVDGNLDAMYLYENYLAVLYSPSNEEPPIGLHDDAGDDPVREMENDSEIPGSSGDGTINIDIGMPYWIPPKQETGLLIADIGIPHAPAVVRDIRIDGIMISSRLTGGYLHLVSQFMPDLPPIDIWYDGSDEDKELLTARNQTMLDAMTLDDFLPFYHIVDEASNVVENERLIPTENFVRPPSPGGGSIVSIVSINMAMPSGEMVRTGLVADIHHVYASTQSLYLAAVVPEYPPYRDGGPDIRWVPPTFKTRIYRFDLTETPVALVAEGVVKGELLNQFSLGEYENVLRVATTTGFPWDGSSLNHVYCLEPEGNKLAVIGAVNDIAPGERLYAARFMGPRGFLVTFVQIDPLFTLDLSDPRSPSIVGELKVPGYSTYIHPLGPDHMLTLGRDVALDDETPLEQGIQLSIFDIRDFADPRLKFSKIIGERGTWSEVLYNHKALTFLPGQNLMALPVDLYENPADPENPWDYGKQTFTGLYVYRVSADTGFAHMGRIPMEADKYYYGWSRGVFIDDAVYAVNAKMAKKADISNISEPFETLTVK